MNPWLRTDQEFEDCPHRPPILGNGVLPSSTRSPVAIRHAAKSCNAKSYEARASIRFNQSGAAPFFSKNDGCDHAPGAHPGQMHEHVDRLLHIMTHIRPAQSCAGMEHEHAQLLDR